MRLQGVLIILLAIIIVGVALFVAYIFIVPKPDYVLEKYLAAWKEGDYKLMYSLLSKESRSGIGFSEFKEAYRNFFKESGMEIKEIAEVNKVSSNFSEAEMNYHAWLESPYFGAKYLVYELFFVREKLVNWRIEWDYNLIYPGLKFGERVVRRRHLPERGAIFDRHGEPLAIRGEVVTVGLQPGRIKDMDSLTQKLEKLLGVDPEWVKAECNRFSDHPEWFVPLKTLSMEEYQRLDPELRPIPGVFFRKNLGRTYPQSELTAHVVGYIGEVNQDWFSSHPELDYSTGDIAGRTGIEQAFEEQLRGQPGYTLVVPGEEERVLLEKAPVRGDDIYLSLDITVQRAAWEALGDREGAFIVIDPGTGDLLALVNRPSFDPNRFSLGITTREWEELRNDPRQPMFNRALQGLYPPGSVFKVVTAAAALNSGIVSSDTEFTDSGTYRVRGNLVRNYRDEVFQEHLFADAVTHSINTTFAKIGIKLGADRLREYALRFGLEEEEEFPLPVKTSKLGSLDSPVNLAWTAVGQARVVVTPLQMAEVIATIAGGGELKQPQLIYKRLTYNAGGEVVAEEYTEPEVKRKVIRSEKAEELTRLLIKVVEEGTGKQARIPGFKLAGKTGTAEIASDTEVTHAWFIGFTPASDPAFAFAIFLEEGGVGGEAAAPVARTFLKEIFEMEEPYVAENINNEY